MHELFMRSEGPDLRFRRWYRVLLKLYPRAVHDRFGDDMAQAFDDLVRDRTLSDEGGLARLVLWMFAETFVNALGAHMASIKSVERPYARVVAVTLLLVAIPLIAMQFTDEVRWDLADFVFAAVLLISAGSAFEWISRKGGSTAYRAGAGLAVFASLLLVWINLAVGIIGNEENPANLMYGGVIVVAIVGTLIARFEAARMVMAMYAAAIAQTAVCVIALAAGLGSTFVITGFFVAIWLLAAAFFRSGVKDGAKSA